MFFTSNKNKLVMSFIALLLVGLLASTVVAYLHVKNRIEIAIETEIQLKANFVVNELHHWTQAVVEQVNSFALYLEDHELDTTKHHHFDAFLKWHPYDYGMQYLGYVNDRDGKYNISDWQVPDGYDARQRGWYIAGKSADKAAFGKPYISIESDKKAWLAITSPIKSQGSFIGLASAHITFDYMLSVLRNIDMDMAGSVFLVDQQGDIVLATLQNVDDIWPQQVESIFLTGKVEGILPITGSSSHTFYVTPAIEGLNNHIVFAIPNELIANKIYQSTLTLLGKFLIIFLLLLVALYFSNRHLLAPLFDYLELDSVTLLPSKKNFKQQVEQHFLVPKNKGRLLIINMENFNRITASYPAAYVSLLQNKIKDRVQAQLTTSSLLGNFSESRYIAYCQQSDSENNELLESLSETLAERYAIAGSEIYCNFRIGASDYPEHGENIETLIDNAFSALGSLSRQDCNNYSVFTAQINQEFSDVQQIHNAMKKGLSKAEFTMVYQPQVNILTGKLFAVESLVRWYSNSLNRMVSPAEFIPIAESNGLMNSLGDNIIRQVFRQIAKWNKFGINIPSVSINISPQQLLASNFYDNILINIQCFDIPAAQIELEITETCLLVNPKETIALLYKLSEHGFAIAIDDFGTGYSSLEYLNSMPLHKLKIDRAFVVDLDKKEKSAVLVKTIIAMANNLGLEVLAEGVERQEEAEALLALGCSKIQGYFYSKPLAANELEAYIAVNV
jgi:EAL domain-containing protein (putative c-di-GMP-specific phosphodiesterase class I)/GGDEF domain-containing protein